MNEKREWLAARGVQVQGALSKAIENLSPSHRTEFHRHFDRCREELLDNHLGRCVLRDSHLAKIVADSLLFFDGDRYRMGDFVVMPNHVHLLSAFRDADSMRAQFDSWLHYTAVQINRKLRQSGKFWHGEPFDHLVRSPEQYEYLRGYIRDNPEKAQVASGDYLYRGYDGG